MISARFAAPRLTEPMPLLLSKCLPFTKASACGNDFLIIDLRNNDLRSNDLLRNDLPTGDFLRNDLHVLTRRICDRHDGVGADGVEWLSASQNPDADALIRLINADGSDAEISGNGTRCVAAYLAANGSSGSLRISTGAGIKQCELISRNGNSFEFEMDMGRPQVAQPFALKLSVGEVTGTPVSMGNPQYAIFVDQFPANWQALGAEVQRQPVFTEGVNVDFVRVIGQSEIEVRFFERGAGETKSSGTGSCASAVAAISAGRAQSPLTVRAEGGAQTVRWSRENDNISLRGPAQLVCKGEFFV